MNVSAIASLEFITRLTLFLSLTLLATGMLRRKHPVVAATVHDYVLVGLLALPILALCGVSVRCGILPVRPSARQVTDRPTSSESHPSAQVTNTRRLEMPDSGEHRATQVTAAVQKAPAMPPIDEKTMASSQRPRGMSIEHSQPTRNRLPAFTTWGIVLAVYFCGLTLLLARIAAGLALLRRLVSQSSPVISTEWLAEVVDAQSALGHQRPVRVFRSDFITTPMTFIQSGAVILIPSECSRGQPRPSNAPRSSFTNWCTSSARTSSGRCFFGPSRRCTGFIRSCGCYHD